MSYKKEKQPQPEIQGDKRVEEDSQGSRAKAKHFYGPSALTISCWIIFTYSGIIQLRNPRWDFLMLVTVFTFSVLVFGFFLLPLVVLSSILKWWAAPKEKKEVALSSFAGWASAWGILILGFKLVPWGEVFP